jgi:hypothetical protein
MGPGFHDPKHDRGRADADVECDKSGIPGLKPTTYRGPTGAVPYDRRAGLVPPLQELDCRQCRGYEMGRDESRPYGTD